MPTPHIEAQKGEIAKIVLMPGDPLRAKVFADNYLENSKQVNSIRGMLAFTGTINGKAVTVMGHGMGMSSIGIYVYELYKFYDVETIIRFGSCGAYTADIHLFDIIIAEKAFEDAGYGSGFGLDGPYSNASSELITLAQDVAADLNLDRQIITGTAHSSQWFYKETNKKDIAKLVSEGILVVEMEAGALYPIASYLNKKALVILTSSDNLITHEETTPDQRRDGFTDVFNILIKMVEKL